MPADTGAPRTNQPRPAEPPEPVDQPDPADQSGPADQPHPTFYAPLDRPATPLEQLLRHLAERGVDPDWQTNLPRYRHDDHIPWHVEATAREALERSDEIEDDAA